MQTVSDWACMGRFLAALIRGPSSFDILPHEAGKEFTIGIRKIKARRKFDAVIRMTSGARPHRGANIGCKSRAIQECGNPRQGYVM
jgi:hypothetical protein